MADKIFGNQSARTAATFLTGESTIQPITESQSNVSPVNSLSNPMEGAQQNVSPVKSLSNPMEGAQQNLNTIQNNIQSQITAIQNNPLEVNVARLVGVIDESFNTMKNRITDASLASVKKSALELDAYFNSPTGDQRAGARIKMAESVKGNLMQSAYQAVSAVYEQHTKDVVSLSLQGAQINASIAGQKAQAIVSLMGQQTSAYLSVLSESNKSYLAQLDNNIKMAQIQLDTQFKYDQLDQQASQFDITTSFNYDQLKQQSNIASSQLAFDKYKLDQTTAFNYDQLNQQADQFNSSQAFNYSQLRQDKEKFQATLDNQREQFATQMEFDKYKQEQMNAFNEKQLAQSRDLNQQQIDIQKNQVAMDSTAKMMQLLSGASPDKSYTAADITTVYKAMTGNNGLPDSTILSMSGWPDQDRVNRFMSTASGDLKSSYQQYVDYGWSKALADAKKGTNIH